MSKSGKVLVEIPDVPEAATFIYETCFATVERWVPPESIFFPGLDENLHEALDAWLPSLIILDNPAIANCGSDGEVQVVKTVNELAFEVIEKIQSLRGKEE